MKVELFANIVGLVRWKTNFILFQTFLLYHALGQFILMIWVQIWLDGVEEKHVINKSLMDFRWYIIYSWTESNLQCVNWHEFVHKCRLCMFVMFAYVCMMHYVLWLYFMWRCLHIFCISSGILYVGCSNLYEVSIWCWLDVGRYTYSHVWFVIDCVWIIPWRMAHVSSQTLKLNNSFILLYHWCIFVIMS